MQAALIILVVAIPVITLITLLSGLLLHYLIAPRMGWRYPKATSILVSFIVMAFLYAALLVVYVNATSKSFSTPLYILFAVLFISIIMMGVANYALMRSFEKEMGPEDKNS